MQKLLLFLLGEDKQLSRQAEINVVRVVHDVMVEFDFSLPFQADPCIWISWPELWCC
jgi:hypothetical protein